MIYAINKKEYRSNRRQAQDSLLFCTIKRDEAMELWEPRRRIEMSFERNLRNIAGALIARVGEETDPDVVKRTLRILSRLPEFQIFAESAALKMVTQLFEDQGRTWREAARHSSRGQDIYNALRQELRGRTGQLLMQQVNRNAEIIKTLPIDIASDVTQYVAAETLKGRRASDIAHEIAEKFPAQTTARAQLIARTEVSKTQMGLIEARCRQFGVGWYVWRACGGSRGDGRTRRSHRGMSSVMVSWDNPPAPEDLFPVIGKNGKRYRNSLGHYHAGCCPNCRCYAEPVIDLDIFDWPMRIYHGGSIRRLRRRDFEKIA